jgi:hypothetical protein
MASRAAGSTAGIRLADCLSTGVLVKTFPLATVHAVLAETGRASQRERELPAHVMAYYVIALALYSPASYGEVLRSLLEGARWLAGPDAAVHVPGRSGISQARTRLGEAPLRQLFARVVHPVATPATPGAFYRRWRTVGLDGTTLEVADTRANARAFGRPTASRGTSAYPQLRLVGLVETGTHVVFDAALGPYATSEVTLAAAVLPALTPGLLCLADRFFPSFDLWQAAAATGAQLLWRIRTNARLPMLERFADGSYRSELRPTWHSRATDRRPIPVRVIEYTLPQVRGAASVYRLVTTLREPTAAPAAELAALYHERWEAEGLFDELKTHLKGAQLVLRSKTPELVRQEVWGLLLAHYAVRGLLHEAAVTAPDGPRDPDTLSFVHAVRALRRRVPRLAAVPPSGPATGVAAASRRAPRRTVRGAGELEPWAQRAARRQTQDDALSSPPTASTTQPSRRLHRPHLAPVA